ncbi:Ig-like domain-containing protein [Bacillus sp. FJAT-53711]|uniref:Ig-like domain-containing protein n=1 Tax=Bacillus yunxiaonensis TaxID=3127665 RepID=A0ABU8FV86_9BACI
MNNTYWKKLMRKTFMGITIFLLGFTTFLAQAGNVFAAADVTKPVLKGISINKKEVTAGDTVEVSVEAEDTESGIKWIDLRYMSPITQKEQSVHLSYNPETNKYVGYIKVDSNSHPGTWEISIINIFDNADNSVSIFNSNLYHGMSGSMDLSSGNFTVSGTSPDTTKPTFKSVTVNKNAAIAGDTIEVSIEAEDTESGVGSVKVYYKSPITQKGQSADLSYNPEINKYIGYIKIDKDFGSGVWKIDNIFITDTAGNSLFVANSDLYHDTAVGKDLSGGNFAVSGTSPDTTKPTFKSVTVNKNAALVGDSVEVSIEAEDTESGVQSIYLYYQSPIAQKLQYVSLSYNSGTNKYVGYIKTNEYFESGVWKINSIYITDAADNTLSIYNKDFRPESGGIDLSNADLLITKPGEDLIAPAAPKVNTVTDQTTEVTGTTEAKANVAITANGKTIASATADTNGTFTIKIPKQTAGTELLVTATDKANNVSKQTKVIVQDVTAPNKPEVNTVSYEATEVTGIAEAGATVTIYADGKLLSSTTADSNGAFTISIPVQKAETELVITATDQAGNTSEETKVTVKDMTAPSKPEVHAVTDKTTEVTGKTEPNAVVSIFVNTTQIGSAAADKDGNFTVQIPAQKGETELTVIATDKAGNKSEPVKVTVKQSYIGWTKINNNWHYYKPETGTPQTDWSFIDNQWYFFNKEGIMQTNWQQINGTWYFLNQSGAMQTGWAQIGGAWYFLNQSGAMQTGWAQIGGTWYFLNQSGTMQTGWAQIGSTWYLFNTSGTMQTGWTFNNGTWYFLNQNGAMQTSWQQINGTWFYFYTNGRMAANTTIGGYKLSANGALI